MLAAVVAVVDGVDVEVDGAAVVDGGIVVDGARVVAGSPGADADTVPGAGSAGLRSLLR
jgi:hypothetical protein